MWHREHLVGDAGAVHAHPVPDDCPASLWHVETTAPALVLGSSEPEAHVDAARCAGAGIAVARRRSGGGSVLVVPGEMTWVDVIVPLGHPVWDDDVVRASWWLGEAWSGALADLGLDGGTVHRGALVSSPWSRHVCFAGVGPGEVLLAGRKVVGVSQRRTRTHARFQCAVHHRWRPDLVASLLADPAPSPDDLASVVAVVDRPTEDVVDALWRRVVAVTARR